MIKLSELNPHNYETTEEIDNNLQILCSRLNELQGAYNQPMIITSGLRSDAQQKALIAAGKSNAPKSKHLTGQAADIFDPTGKLKLWAKNHIEIFEKLGLWLEDFKSTPTWLHVQIVPPKSQKRIFKP